MKGENIGEFSRRIGSSLLDIISFSYAIEKSGGSTVDALQILEAVSEASKDPEKRKLLQCFGVQLPDNPQLPKFNPTPSECTALERRMGIQRPKAEADRKAAEEQEAQAKRVAEARPKVEAKEKEGVENDKCREDIQCWGDKHNIAATIHCREYIEKLAKYDFEWTDGWFETKLSRFRWKDQSKGQITYLGDKIKSQNGFGAFQAHTYTCVYDPETETVLGVSARPGRL